MNTKDKIELLNLIDCEIECIKDGDSLTPIEQKIAIDTCENIKNRIEGAF